MLSELILAIFGSLLRRYQKVVFGQDAEEIGVFDWIWLAQEKLDLRDLVYVVKTGKQGSRVYKFSKDAP